MFTEVRQLSCREKTDLVDVLALELRDELVEALVIGLNADGLKDSLDVLGRGGGVATEAEEKVSGEVLHFDCGISGSESKVSQESSRYSQAAEDATGITGSDNVGEGAVQRGVRLTVS